VIDNPEGSKIDFMSVRGGSADKFGNRYEALWAIDQLLRIVDGGARSLTLEPIERDESRGVEFVVADTNGTSEYWSVKRQTIKASGWTVALLATKDERGRTILGDLLEHVERDPSHRGFFASSQAAVDFEELRSAVNKGVLDERLQQSAKLSGAFQKYVLPLCSGDNKRAQPFLLRVRTHAVDEARLKENVDFAIRKLFYAAADALLDVAAVRGYLGDLLLENIHCTIDRDQAIEALRTHGIGLRDWAIDRTVPNRFDQICDAYTSPLKSDLINGTLLPLAGSESILSVNGTPSAKKVLVVADAGGGKSAILGDVAERLHVAGIPVLPIRFDQLPDGILTTTEMGHKLLLPESPAMVLAGVANGKPSVLLIDQLDAVSMASGRRLELWSLFDELSRDVARYPEMSMIVGCREFDLEHDPRMRKMKAEGGEFTIVKLQPLSSEQVDGALRNSCTDPSSVQATLKPILATPLHLSMFLSLPTSKRTGVHSRDELFDNFWTEGECRTDQRIGRKSAWTQVIDRLADWLSANRQLSAPMHVLDDYRADAAAMVSGRVIILTDNRYRFFHESFFDYAFARRFAAKDGALTSLLLSDEQHLFRRAQVRQVLAYLRAHDWPRYIKELRDVLSHSKVRFHIKRLVFQWLSTVPDPQIQEWEILQRLLDCAPDLRSHVRTVIAGHAGWFDVLDTGFFDAALSSSNATQVDEAVWIFGLHPTLEKRSDRVAALLKKYRKPGEQWSHYLRHVCRFGEVYHSPEMFDFFLSLIDDGTLDDLRPAFAANDSWWSTLHSMAQRRPDLACEAIGHWFDRTLLRWRDNKAAVDASAQGAGKSHRFGQYLDQGMNGTHVIWKAAEAPLHYAKQMLPRVGRFVTETAEERSGRYAGLATMICRFTVRSYQHWQSRWKL